jgi:hypothetical protein
VRSCAIWCGGELRAGGDPFNCGNDCLVLLFLLFIAPARLALLVASACVVLHHLRAACAAAVVLWCLVRAALLGCCCPLPAGWLGGRGRARGRAVTGPRSSSRRGGRSEDEGAARRAAAQKAVVVVVHC